MTPIVSRTVALVAAWVSLGVGPVAAQSRPLIIDVHLHAFDLAWFRVLGTPPHTMCLGAYWPAVIDRFPNLAPCRDPATSPATEEGLIRETTAALRRYHVIGLASGPRETVERWQRLMPGRIIPVAGYVSTPDSARAWARRDTAVRALGEMTWQYDGRAATDSLPSAWFSLAEELDLPIGIHMGAGPAGAAYVMAPTYRIALSDPLQLEPVLAQHPKLRVFVMHAGWPMLDHMVALLQAHPQVAVDISAIDWFVTPRAEFHAYLKRLIDAGFGDRVMFGSDQSVWPAGIGRAIAAIESAPFLTAAAKRDIFCRNAARFFRLDRPNGRLCR